MINRIKINSSYSIAYDSGSNELITLYNSTAKRVIISGYYTTILLGKQKLVVIHNTLYRFGVPDNITTNLEYYKLSNLNRIMI